MDVTFMIFFCAAGMVVRHSKLLSDKYDCEDLGESRAGDLGSWFRWNLSVFCQEAEWTL